MISSTYFRKLYQGIGLVLCLLICSSGHALAQDYYKPGKRGRKSRDDIRHRVWLQGVNISFNFLTGPDANDYTTTLNGLGSISGLLIVDNIHLRNLVLFRVGKKTALHVGSGLGIIAKKYRFSENLVFENRNDRLISYIDANPLHEYSSNFFSFSKSKLVMTYIRVPLMVGFNIVDYAEEKQLLGVSAGGVFEVLAGAKHKLRYTEGETNTVNTLRNNADLNARTFQVGIQAQIELFDWFGIQYAYMLTPMFQENRGPDLNAMEFGFYFVQNLFEK